MPDERRGGSDYGVRREGNGEAAEAELRRRDLRRQAERGGLGEVAAEREE
jgi:hypothetical protein